MASVTPNRRAVLTGIGLLSPIGSDMTTFWRALLDGKSGIRPITKVDVSELACRIAGDVPEFVPRKIITDKEQVKSLNRMMARTVQLGVCAAQLAMNDVAMPKDYLDPTRFGVEFGSAMIHSELDDIGPASKISTNCQPGSVDINVWGETGMKEIPPLWMLKYLPNMPSCHVSIFHNIQGPSNTITSGDASSLLALGEAWRILERGLVDFFLVGGCESKLNPLNYIRQSLFWPLTSRNEPPQEALRPFDEQHDGTVLGEGSAVVGLETLEHAQKRGAKIYAELVGFASGFDRPKEGRVFAKVIRRALQQANITPEEIDHINGHGLGTPEADRWEASAIAEVFGASTPVWSIKPHIGSAGPAGSLLELVGSVLALQHGQLPAALNCTKLDPQQAPILVHTAGPRPITKPYVLKLSLTELGHVGAAVIRKV